MTLCYRPFYNINFFRFKYLVKHSCTGNCQFSISREEEKYSSPYLEFIVDYLSDFNIKNIEDFIIKGYFKNRNELCKEEICKDENNGNIQNFKYNILKCPLIISIYISMNFNNLNKNQKKLKELFINDFKIKNRNYKLLGVILMPDENHFITIFKNLLNHYNMKINSWYMHDDLNGYIKPLDDIGFRNEVDNNKLLLFIYGIPNNNIICDS